MIAPYASTPPPIDAATLLNTPINPEEVPIMIGTFPPTGPMENSCTSVTTTGYQHGILQQGKLQLCKLSTRPAHMHP